VRNHANGSELTTMRWGMPPPPKFGGPPVTNIRNAASPKGKKPRKASAGQKEMLLPIEGKGRAEKKAAKPQRSAGRRKAG
jgi:putative SOS response-associated peptidase YedK